MAAPKMNMSTCRSCGAQIVWIKLRSGKSMPCDPYILNYRYDKSGREKLVTPYGDIVNCETDVTRDKTDGYGYRSHFSTCPHADKHRKTRIS